MAVGCSADTEFTETIRIVLLGKVGSGKSSTGNTILGREDFRVAIGLSPRTKAVSERTAFRNKIKIEVCDTPDIFDSSHSYSEGFGALLRLCHRPNTIILYTITLGSRFTQEDVVTFMTYKDVFDEHLIMVGFTRGDMLEREGISIEDYIQKDYIPTSLKEILEYCGWNYFVFKNGAPMSSRNEQARQLLEIIESKLRSPSSVNLISSLSLAVASDEAEFGTHWMDKKRLDYDNQALNRLSNMSMQASTQRSEERRKSVMYDDAVETDRCCVL